MLYIGLQNLPKSFIWVHYPFLSNIMAHNPECGMRFDVDKAFIDNIPNKPAAVRSLNP